MENIENSKIVGEEVTVENAELKISDTDLQKNKIKPLFEIASRDNIFAVFALIAGVFTSVFGIFGGFSFGYMMSAVLFILVLTAYFINQGNVRLFPLLCVLLSLGNCASFITTTNSSVKFFSFVISIALLLVGTYSLALGRVKGNRATVGAFYSALSTMGNVGVSVKSLLSSSDGKKKSIGKVMLGLLCAVPVLVVIVPLLISSDDAFSGMMSNIFADSGNTFTIVVKAIFGAVLSLFVISYGFSLKAGRIGFAKEKKQRSVDNVCIISFLSAIAVCYVLYLFSQLAYFFSAFEGFLPDQNITYAQYARKGFFEMCIIAVINLILVFSSLLLAKKQDGKVCIAVRAISTFISVFTIMIIATAISKMVLYIKEYGMTILRVNTSAFMLFLAITFIAVILRIYVNNINIVKITIITAGIIVLLLGTVNVNHVCAKYNYDAYNSRKLSSVDVEAMYNLGDEGIPYVVKLVYCEDKTIATKAKQYLAQAYKEDYFENMCYTSDFDVEELRSHQKYKSFSYFSLPMDKAYDVLYSFMEKNPQFGTYCLNYYSNIYNQW